MSTERIMGTTGAARAYKRWPEALKREIVAASFAPGASVSVVARQYDVNANQVFNWRKRYPGVAAPSATSTPLPALLPVTILPEPAAVDDVAPAPRSDRCVAYHAQRESAAPESPSDRCTTCHAQREPAAPEIRSDRPSAHSRGCQSAAPTSSDTIEIEVGGMYLVRVGVNFDDRALGRILDLLSHADGVRKKGQ